MYLGPLHAIIGGGVLVREDRGEGARVIVIVVQRHRDELRPQLLHGRVPMGCTVREGRRGVSSHRGECVADTAMFIDSKFRFFPV